MKTPEQITNSLVKEFDKLNDIREQSLKLSREIIKSCSKSIRNVHRNNLDEAKQHLDEANKNYQNLRSSLKDIPELRFAGYVNDSERELIEAFLVFEFEKTNALLEFEGRMCLPQTTYRDLVMQSESGEEKSWIVSEN